MDGHTESPTGLPSLRDFVRSHRADLLARWTERVRALPPARDLPLSSLIDHLPAVLDRVLAAMDALSAGGLDGAPQSHAVDRLSRGFDLDHVVHEYALLRRCVLDMWEEAEGGTIALGELRQLDAGLDEAISESVVEYARARERLLRAVDRIADAAMGQSDIVDFLHQLLRVTVETATAVETAAVLLREGDLLRLRAATGLDRDLDLGFTVRIGEGFSGTVAAQRRPISLSNAAAHPLLKSAMLRERGVRALYGVPLIHEDEVIGVAHIGSTTATEFSEEDKLLFRAMSSRATAVIVQSQLVARERQAHQELQEAHARLLEAIDRERRANEEAVQTRRRGEEASSLLDTLLATAPVGFGFLDTSLRYVRLNLTLAELHGLPVEAHLGRRVEDILPPQAAAKVVPLLRRVLETGQALVALEISEQLSPTRSSPDLLVSYYPVPGPDGQPLGLGVVTTDISERKRIEERQRALFDEAQRATRLREQVLAIVSHDLKNPLAVIGMSAMVIGRACTELPQARKQVETIQRSVARMDHLIADLLDMASIQEGKLAVTVAPLAVDALIDEALEIHGPLALEQGVRLGRAEAPTGLEVLADRGRVQQVLANLIGNALKFSPRGAEIAVGAVARGGEVLLSVRDTGPGIAADQLSLIFAPYWSGDTQARRSTGLGLFITKGIVEAHGGRTWAESRVGAGSTFYFTLPRHQAGDVPPR